MSGDCGFNEILDAAGLCVPKIKIRVGPLTYERDEYRFWHRLIAGNVQVAVQADVFAPALHVSLGKNTVSVEGSLFPPQWVHEVADSAKWFASEIKTSYCRGYRKGQYFISEKTARYIAALHNAEIGKG